METKLKCAVCGAVFSAVIVAEASNLVCDHCGHLSKHLPEENFRNNNIDRVSSVIFTASPSAAITDNEFE